jgi:hypothetical protein
MNDRDTSPEKTTPVQLPDGPHVDMRPAAAKQVRTTPCETGKASGDQAMSSAQFTCLDTASRSGKSGKDRQTAPFHK